MQKSKQTIEEIFIKDSTTLRIICKKTLIDEKLIPHMCQWCELKDSYNGKPLTLQLDHINGINNDNRLENLRFLCPNCHSQTETYNGRNKGNNYKYTKRCHKCRYRKVSQYSFEGYCKKCSDPVQYERNLFRNKQMKINGRDVILRGSNHKHTCLDDLDKILDMLKTKSMAQLAKELSVPANSIRYRLHRYCSEEQLAAITKQRCFHQKKKTLDK